MRYIPILLLAAMAGCVTPKFDSGAVSRLTPGVSTQLDAQRLLGPPSARSIQPDGNTLLQWIDIQGGILNQAHAAHVALLFSPDGKMLRVAHQFQKDNRP